MFVSPVLDGNDQQSLTYILAYEASISACTSMSVSHDQHVPCLYTKRHLEIRYTEFGSELRTFNALIVLRLAGGYIGITRPYTVQPKYLRVDISMWKYLGPRRHMGYHSQMTPEIEIEAQAEVFQWTGRCTSMQEMQHKASQQHLLG